MEAKARQKLVERARALEKAGQLDAAAQAFREASAFDDEARVLSAQRKPKEAARVLVESLGVHPGQAGQLDAAGKKRALMAAIYFSKANEIAAAVELFVALGEKTRASELLRRAGDEVGAARLQQQGDATSSPSMLMGGPRLPAPSIGGASESVAERLEASGKMEPALSAYVAARRFSDAARVAMRLQRPAEAAQLHLEAGEPYEAAGAWLEARDPKRALDAFILVPRDDPRYRTAATRALSMAAQGGGLTFELEHFLGRFLMTAPRDVTEARAFSMAGILYDGRRMTSDAAVALRKALAFDPDDREAAARLAAIEGQLAPTAAEMGNLVADADLHFKAPKSTALPELEPLPDLPGLPVAAHAMPTFRSPSIPPRGGAGGTPGGWGGGGATGGVPAVTPGRPPGGASGMAGAELAPGAMVADRYRIHSELGRGGMAVVFRARDLELEEDVALKIFPGPGSPELLARFKQELKLSRQVVHANVVRLFDIGSHGERRYISMELLHGQTLKQRLAGELSIADGVGFLVQACQGLQAAHDKGVIHRDVKPDNFFLTSEDVLKVMDFGIAKAQAAPGLTTGNAMAGTPAYMSPEQISAFSQVTHATDVYALGCCAYEMFTGAPPFVHAEVVPLLMMHMQNPVVSPRAHRPDLPAELEQVILAMLEKDPQRRPSSCREVAAMLSRALA